jgi:thioester reductase-like protein
MHYFITGGTGILGTEIITQLVRRKQGAQVTLLIRAADQGGAEARLVELLKYTRYWNPSLDYSGVEAVCGDVTEHALGLAPVDTARLQSIVTHVVHSAASIKLGGEWAEMRHINVEGTRKVAGFAMGCSQLQRLVPISTAYVAGRREGEVLEADLDKGQVFVNHYERSKLEAEQLVRSLMSKIPVTVVRPSIIVGDAKDGHIRSFQNIYTPMYFVGTGAIPALPGEPDVLLDIVPVDYVAAVVVKTMHAEACVGGTYHACSGEGRLVSLSTLRDAARQTLGKARWNPKAVAQSALVKKLTCFFDYLAHTKCFGSEDLKRDLASAAPEQPNPSDFLPRLMGFWKGANFGRRMPWLSPNSNSNASAMISGGRALTARLGPKDF